MYCVHGGGGSELVYAVYWGSGLDIVYVGGRDSVQRRLDPKCTWGGG